MKRYRKLFYGSIDLQERTDVDGYVYTIAPHDYDHLGPANAEQRAETRESWRTWFKRTGNALAVIVTAVVVGGLLILVGLVIGASKPDDVRELVPLTPEPSGERAEPEEGAR